ncbi:MAG: S8 family peptidase [Tepidisphaeraceae bacterium]
MFESLEGRRLYSFSNWGTAEQLIQLPDAIQAFQDKGITLDGTGQTIAVIDSGIDHTLPQLGAGFGPGHKIVGGYDFVDNDSDPTDPGTGTTEPGHGTEVAGLLAASPYTDNGIRYQGIAPGAQLVDLRVYDGTNPVPDSRIADALQWVIDHRTDFNITVVNISLGQGSYNSATISTVYGNEIQELHDDGVTIVASAGNAAVTPNQGITSPAADPNVISVGSVNAADVISDFSQRGPNLSLLAPGDDVETTFIGGGFGMVAGTSYATPIVAGTVALMRQIDPTLKPADELSILRASGVQNFDGDTEIGTTTRLIYPRLDILNAVNMTAARIAGDSTQQALLGKYGNGNSIAIDAEGVTHLVYYDSGDQTMKYATRSTSGVWSATQTIDDSLPYQGYYLSLALDPQGQPTVAYFDGQNGDLKYASYDGTKWTIESIDVKNSTGLYPSMVYDRNGLPLIAYYRKTTGDFRVARRGFGPAGTWTVSEIDSNGDVGRSTTAAVDSKGDVGVAYEDSSSGWLKYAIMNPRTGKFSRTVIDKTTRGVSFISTAFSTADGNPWISYYDASPANLKVARFENRHWVSTRLAYRGATGLFTNLFFAGDDDANIVYYDKHHESLYLATLVDGTWDYTILKTSGGRDASVALDPIAGLFRYTYYDNTSGYIRVDQRSV